MQTVSRCMVIAKLTERIIADVLISRYPLCIMPSIIQHNICIFKSRDLIDNLWSDISQTTEHHRQRLLEHIHRYHRYITLSRCLLPSHNFKHTLDNRSIITEAAIILIGWKRNALRRLIHQECHCTGPFHVSKLKSGNGSEITHFVKTTTLSCESVWDLSSGSNSPPLQGWSINCRTDLIHCNWECILVERVL